MENTEEIITAQQAREIVAKSDAYRRALLTKFCKEIKSQAEQGLSWAIVSYNSNDSQTTIRFINNELILMGYSIEDATTRQTTIMW